MSGIFHSLVVSESSGVAGLLIATDTANVNLRAMLVAEGWDEVSVVTATLTIASTAKIYSNSTGVPALTTGAPFPAGSSISIINNGYILGRGGNGGNGGPQPAGTTGGAGNAGGIAFTAEYAVSVTNNGIIGGGGGGGGGAYNIITGSPSGGGGIGGSLGGSPGSGSLNNSTSYQGETGTLLLAGRGYAIDNSNGHYASGNGGFYGDAGQAGSTIGPYSGGPGGVAGAAVSGNSLITWIATGTRYGAIT